MSNVNYLKTSSATTLPLPLFAAGVLTSPQFTAHPSDVVVAQGQTTEFTCPATGEPAPSVTWYREDAEEALETGGGGRFSLGGSGELRISSVVPEDEGSYYCLASNAAGSVRSLSASLELAGECVGSCAVRVVSVCRCCKLTTWC